MTTFRKPSAVEVNAMKSIIRIVEQIDVPHVVSGVAVNPAQLSPSDAYSKEQYDKEVNIMKKLIADLSYVEGQTTSQRIRERLDAAGKPYYSNSNISDFIEDGEIDELIAEATAAFANVLDVLVIDQQNDPNAIGTAKRLAKMYINELMEGRYYPAPDITAFPNQHTGKDTGFGGMLVVRSEIKSMCSHHHQIVDGVAYIGIIPKGKVIGLSKYTRLAQHLARRGTLQEELAEDIAQGIMEATGSADVGIMVMATHGCCQNRGIMANNSNTQTTVLYGDFMDDPTVRKEFHDNVMMQILKEGR